MFITEDHFYVCLLSNNSLDIYPNNVLSAFTNKLHVPINFDDSWSVGITEIGFNNFKLIKVRSKRDLPAENSPSKKAKFINTEKDIMLPDSNITKNVLKIPFTEFNSSIEIDGRIIKEKFTNTIDLDKLLIFFSSNIKTHPDLSITDYLTLKDKIKFSVIEALREGNYNDRKITISKSENTLSVNIPIVKNKDNSYKMQTIFVEIKDYDTIKSFLHEILLQCPKTDRNITVLIEFLEASFAYVRSRQVPQTDSIIHTQIDGREAVITPYHLQNLSPKSNNVLILPAPGEVGSSLFHTPIQLLHTTAKSPQPILSSYNNMEYIYIYTDLIKPRFIGKDRSRFLRIAPIFHNENRICFNHIEYCPIEKTYVDSISILIMDGYGKRINFIESYIPTYIMLHFKKNSINMGLK